MTRCHGRRPSCGAASYDVKPEDVDRLSPLGLKHINMLGRYAFTLPDPVARGELRPLRDPLVELDGLVQASQLAQLRVE
jgi:hypothetical protein